MIVDPDSTDWAEENCIDFTINEIPFRVIFSKEARREQYQLLVRTETLSKSVARCNKWFVLELLLTSLVSKNKSTLSRFL